MGISAYFGAAAATSWIGLLCPFIGGFIGGFIGAWIVGKFVEYAFNSVLKHIGYNDKNE
jgi:hypothetical protein